MRYSPASKLFSLIRLASHDFLLAPYNYPEQLCSVYDVIIVRLHSKSPINHTRTLHKGKHKMKGHWAAAKDFPAQVQTNLGNFLHLETHINKLHRLTLCRLSADIIVNCWICR